jgi:putative PEP-CTERM system TPR-repeat lipoprotein
MILHRHGRALVCVGILALVTAGCTKQSDADLVASAKSLLEQKDTKGAVIQLKSALQKNPDSPQARLALGKILLQGGDGTSALVELRKALELQVPDEQVIPEIARAMLLAGEEAKLIAQYGELTLRENGAAADLRTSVATARAFTRDADGARKAVSQALGFQPGFAPALLLQARLHAAAGEFDPALALLADVLAKDPGNERAGVFEGDILWHGKRDPDAAMQSFRKVLAAHADSQAAHSSVIELLFEQKKLDEARQQFALLKKVAPNHPETLFIEAQIAFADKNYKSARELLDRVFKVAPENVRALELAGASEYRQSNYVQAEAFLGRAIKNAPGLLLSRQLLAQTYLRMGQPDKALDVLKPVTDGKQPDGTTLALAAEAWLQTGDVKRSEAAFAAATKAAPADPRVRTSAAMASMARGQLGNATSELEAIASEDSGPRADLALVSARLRQNDLSGALKAIDGLQRKLPDRPLADNLRGRVLLLKRDLPGAAKAFEAALAKDPQYFPAVASLAALEFSNGKPEAARKRFEDLLQAQPKNSRALLALAELGARSGAPAADVTGLMRQAVKANPQDATAHQMLVGRLLSGAEPKAALAAAQEAVAALPNNPSLLETLGRTQVAAGEANQAVSTFAQLAAQQPRNAMHHVQLAEAHTANKDTASAARELRRALEIQPELPAARRAMVALALLDKRPQDAIALVHEMQKKDPKDAAVWVMEGDIESGRKNWDAAAAAYRSAAQRAPNPDLAAKLHQALRQGGKATEADRMAAEWLKAHPKDPGFRYYLGDAALARGEWSAAEGHYRSVLELQPGNALALNNVAWLVIKQGKPGALPMAEQANTLLPNRAALLDTLALALAADKQLPKAIEAQKKSIALSPQDAALKLNLARLYVQAGDKAMARAELEDLARLGDKFNAQTEVATLLKSL